MRYAINILMCALCLVACGSGGAQKRSTPRVRQQAPAPTAPPARYGYRILKSHPHDPGAYTQGLVWHDGALWESTGEYGRSKLRRVELETGATMREKALADEFFGEGAALLNGKIYQLTWLEGRAFVYDAATLERTGEFAYRGEGWGLTTDGEKLYMSDGTANITVRDPATFRAERTIAVRSGGRAVQMINELEWIDGRIWANVYMTEQVIIIDPASGSVEGIVDFTGITAHITVTPDTDVMNGIAHDPATGRIFVTGKNWDRLFEVEVFKK